MPQAFAEGLPNLSASLDAGSTRDEYYGPDSVTSLTPSGYSLSASAPLFRGLQTIDGIRATRARVRAGDQRLSATSQRLFADVATSYADVRFLNAEWVATRKRMNAGDSSRIDTAQAEARREQAKVAFSEASANLVESEARYASLVGSLPGKLEPVKLPQKLLPPSLD